MKKILAFFGIGVMILLLDLIFNYDEDELNIFISDQEIESLIYTWELQVGRSPTKEDIKNIIDDVIKEEILYREALRLNLDLEDRIIKRRLAQKISFLREETSMSLSAIGKVLGNRDHSTVLHGCLKISELIHSDDNIKKQIFNIKDTLLEINS